MKYIYMNKSKKRFSSNTSSLLYVHLQRFREQLREANKKMKNIDKTLESARADQKKYLNLDDGDNFYKTITEKNKISKEKDKLEDEIDSIKSDMKSVFLFIRKEGGGRNRNKRRSRKIVRKKSDM